MNNAFLLDTNIVIAYLDNASEIRRRSTGVDLFLSVIVVGELYHGALNSSDKARNLTLLRNYLAYQLSVPCDGITAERFGIIAADLQRRGQPIPDNDIWIAAQAIQYDLTLVTRDAHFERVGGLKLERW